MFIAMDKLQVYTARWRPRFAGEALPPHYDTSVWATQFYFSTELEVKALVERILDLLIQSRVCHQ